MKEIFKLLHLNKTRTMPYHPQSDGLVERFNRTLIGMLAATVEEHPGDWDKNLRAMCMAYNTSVHPSTGFSPFVMIFRRQAKNTIGSGLWFNAHRGSDVPKHVRQIKSTLEGTYSRVREHMATTLDRQKELYDRRVHVFKLQLYSCTKRFQHVAVIVSII